MLTMTPATQVDEGDRNVALVIEDDPDTRRWISLILRARGWRVFQAPDAERGLILAREHVPDVILLDLALPRMSGLEALREMKGERWADQPTPIVVVSAFAMLMRLPDLRLADATVQKPFALRDLLEAVDHARASRRTPSQRGVDR
jgi:two-component system, cell cycle response regulator DivK